MRRILFVDDEPAVLAGLRTALRRERGRWEMIFVDSAPGALAQLEAAPFALLVTDLCMPGMDGTALLRATAERFPHVVRVALSAHADYAAPDLAGALVHRFLKKPCDAETLRRSIEEALAS